MSRSPRDGAAPTPATRAGIGITGLLDRKLDVLREYHHSLGRLIPDHGCTLEHFAGDGLMVFFKDPVSVDDHELQAIRFALAAHQCFANLAQAWKKRGTDLGLGIDLDAGYATLGAARLEGRYDYRALGPVTNLHRGCVPQRRTHVDQVSGARGAATPASCTGPAGCRCSSTRAR